MDVSMGIAIGIMKVLQVDTEEAEKLEEVENIGEDLDKVELQIEIDLNK